MKGLLKSKKRNKLYKLDNSQIVTDACRDERIGFVVWKTVCGNVAKIRENRYD